MFIIKVGLISFYNWKFVSMVFFNIIFINIIYLWVILSEGGGNTPSIDMYTNIPRFEYDKLVSSNWSFKDETYKYF